MNNKPNNLESNQDYSSIFNTDILENPNNINNNQNVLKPNNENVLPTFNNETSNNNLNISENNESSINSNNINNQDIEILTFEETQNIPPIINNENISNSNEELLKSFIGNNYDKITKNSFNFAGFFFSIFYMFYRKMFLYGITLFILTLILQFFVNNSLIIPILLDILIGLFVNKIYLNYANRKINKIKTQNSQKSTEELKNICSKKGRTSVAYIFLGIFTIIFIMFIVLSTFLIKAGFDFFNFNNWNIVNNNDNSKNETLLENVDIVSYTCFFSNCSFEIKDSSGLTDNYSFNSANTDIFEILSNYKDYINLNIYYTLKDDEKVISNYQIYSKINNKDITYVKTENELRGEIGLYTLGTYTDVYTLSEKWDLSYSCINGECEYYTKYVFVDSNNNEYEMKYLSMDTLDLTVGNKYNVTFEVVEGDFEYEYILKKVD